MSNHHITAVRDIHGLVAPTKYVLFLLADHACEDCGLSWPGVPCLMSESELAESTVRRALEQLRERHLIEPLSYAGGGRKRATEYVVLGGIKQLLTAPCAQCRSRRKNPARGGGYDNDGTEKPSTSERVSAIPSTAGGENPPPRGPQASREAEAPRAHAREEAESATSPPGESSAAPTAPPEPLFHPTTGNPELDDMLERLNQRATLNASTQQPRR